MYRLLGVDARLVLVKSKGEEDFTHAALVLEKSPLARIPLPPSWDEYEPGNGVYCEATGHGFTPGVVPDDVDTASILKV